MNNQSNSGGSLAAYPVATVFAGVVLLALAWLLFTRILYGRISIETGTR